MRQRSSYPKQFKVQGVQECLQPGATVSVVPISHDINADVIRKWMPVYRNLAKPCHPAGLFMDVHFRLRSVSARLLTVKAEQRLNADLIGPGQLPA